MKLTPADEPLLTQIVSGLLATGHYTELNELGPWVYPAIGRSYVVIEDAKEILKHIKEEAK